LGVGKPRDVDAEIGGALPVDRHGELRLRGVDRKPRLLEARVIFHPADDLQGGFGQRCAVIADQCQLEAIAGAADTEAVGLHREDAHGRHFLGDPVDVGHDLLLAALALVPRCQRDHHEAAVVLAVVAGILEDAHHLAGIAQRLQQLLDAAHLR
jgi:hypothetical protein